MRGVQRRIGTAADIRVTKVDQREGCLVVSGVSSGSNRCPDCGQPSSSRTYFAAISGTAPAPNLVGKTTDRAFRTFVASLLQILSTMLNPEAGGSNSFTADTALVSRRSLLRIITELISNAAPTSDARERRHRTARSLSLWSTLLAFMTNYQGAEIEQASQHWLVTLRLRFEAALRHCKQKRWPYSPFQGHAFSTRL
jgi:hypothetical protein